MIRKLKNVLARSLLVLVVAAGLGFGVIAAAMAAIIGGFLVLGVRLAADAAPAAEPEFEAPKAEGVPAEGAQPA